MLFEGLSSNSILFWVVCYHAFCFNRLWTSDIVVIGQYLNEKYPQNALLPSDPQLRALNLQVTSLVDSLFFQGKVLYGVIHMKSSLRFENLGTKCWIC